MTRLFVVISMVLALLLSAGTRAWTADFTLRGVVSDVDGRPVAKAEVALYRGKNVKKPAEFASSPTGTDGSYSVAVPAGQYWAVAVLRKGEKRFGPLDLGDKHSGEAVEVMIGPEAELTRDFVVMDLREAAKQNQKKNMDVVRLSGRIVDQDGKPVAMAYALADSGQQFKEMPAYLSAWSDESGGYLLLVPKGRLYVGAATVYPPDAKQSLAKEITLTKDLEGIDLVVTR
ncbi:MAG: carboxypeptidase-like regulatory domain-containing protein [Desulfobulbaceae bacterium]|nr:carboxypeptidase-like regulatory domain-containing protein [Desulfobulbaceae bacterium]